MVGFVGVAWFLGSTAASADETGGVGTPAADRSVAESAGEAGGTAGDARERTRAAVGSEAGRPAERPAAEPAHSADEAVGDVTENASPNPPAEPARSAPAPEVPAVAEHNGGVDAGEEALDTVEREARATERATERIADSGERDGDSRSAEDSRAERTGSAGDPAPSSHERPGQDPRDARHSAASSHAPVAAAPVGDTGSANPTEDGPDRGGSPATSPVSSAPQAQGGSAVPVPAGFLPAASVVPPETGTTATARHASATVPRGPEDEPTVSPD
ncbi:hypothetical protein [Halostreptopolyspora alba]|uniref:hypothetical protein n=1 Tax=Halostreptopolyspora alba TaxID=2487137 RepID=UPI0011CE391D